jgi:hypothetical protein
LIQAGVRQLRDGNDRIVLGPATDGGYYLIGMNRPCPSVFERIEWSTDRVLSQTVEAANAEGLRAVLLDEWRDVDEVADLRRLTGGSGELAASRTRAWLGEHLKG